MPAGLPVERTALAWQRTALVSALVAVPLLVLAARLAAWPAAGAAACAAMSGSVLSDAQRIRARALDAADGAASPWPLLLAVTLTVGLTAAAGVLLAVHLAAAGA